MDKVLNDLTENEIKILERGITRFLKSRKFESNINSNQFRCYRTFKRMNEVCGFAYASSSEFAGYFICNITLFLDMEKKYKINGFGMDEKGWVFADIHNTENGTMFYIHI